MSRRAVPPQGDRDNELHAYLDSLKDAPTEDDLTPFDGIDETSSAAEIGAAIKAYCAKIKG